MKTYRLTRREVVWPILLASCATLSAQSLNCDEVATLAMMARAESSASLIAAQRKAGDDFRAKTVFAFRLFELHSNNTNAAIALDLLPTNDDQHATWMSFGDSLCDSESHADMTTLEGVGSRLPRDLARAVILVPDKLPRYVAYAPIAVQDPHSDYAVQMQVVCRAKHPEFVKAVDGLPVEKKNWFLKHVLNPDGCHVLALAEAD